MGYHTNFEGVLKLDKPLKPEHARYLTAFAQTRRMARKEELTEKRPDPIRKAAGLPVGENGAYFVGEGGYMGQSEGPDVIKFKEPGHGQPCDQPGPWCQWTPVYSDDPWGCVIEVNDEDHDWEGYDAIGWDQGEKFYYYVEWLGYIITHFIEPWGYILNGSVSWDGEESDDIGVIEVKDNVVTVHHGVFCIDQVIEAEQNKNEKKAMVQALEHLATYLIDAEADDFCERLYSYAFKEKDEDKAVNIQEELEKTILKENDGPEHILSEIRKHLEEEPSHIYIVILEALTIVHKNRELSAWNQP